MSSILPYSDQRKWFQDIPIPLLALGCAVLTGLILRLWGIHWGFPRVDLSPDELNVWNISAGLSWQDLDTHFYNYSGLTFYLNFFSAQLARLFGVTLHPHTILLINRLWSVFFGTLTIPLAYLAARDFFSEAKAGAWAAWMVALLPIHVWHSHFGTSDISLVFWITAAFWLALRAFQKPGAARFILGGLAVGVAIGVKFNGMLAGIFFLAAALASWWEKRIRSFPQAMLFLFLAGAAAMVGFFLVSPFSIIHLKATVSAFFFESAHVKGGHYGFDLSPGGWPYIPYIYQFFSAFPFSFGLPLYLAAVSGVAFFILSRKKTEVLLGLAFPFLYLGIVASWKFVPSRYYLPVLPITLILASWGAFRLFSASRGWLRAMAWLLAVPLFAYTLAYDISTVDRFRSDTRLEAAQWAERELPPKSRIILVDPIFDRRFIVPADSPGPMPFSVSLSTVMGKSYMPLFDGSNFEVLTKDLRGTVFDLQRGKLGRGDILILSSLVFLRDVRLGEKAAERLRLWNSIRRNPRKFRRLRVFDAPFINREIYAALDPMFACDFVSPTIEFYEPLARRRPPFTSGDARR
ncbi:MAG: phospholipid carrier-dependent glycosyltransferase [Chrysiogenia bacterium]